MCNCDQWLAIIVYVSFNISFIWSNHHVEDMLYIRYDIHDIVKNLHIMTSPCYTVKADVTPSKTPIHNSRYHCHNSFRANWILHPGAWESIESKITSIPQLVSCMLHKDSLLSVPSSNHGRALAKFVLKANQLPGLVIDLRELAYPTISYHQSILLRYCLYSGCCYHYFYNGTRFGKVKDSS